MQRNDQSLDGMKDAQNKVCLGSQLNQRIYFSKNNLTKILSCENPVNARLISLQGNGMPDQLVALSEYHSHFNNF